MTTMAFNCCVSIPVVGYKSSFVNGELDAWLPAGVRGLDSVDLTLDFEGEVDLDAADNYAALYEVIKGADWVSDYSDAMLKGALDNLCRVVVPDDINDFDPVSGDGCDGVVILELSDDVSFSDPSWTTVNTDADEVDWSSLGVDVAREAAFSGSDGFEGSWFFDSIAGEVYEGSPMSNASWR